MAWRDPANESAPPRPHYERRSAPRRRVFLKGKIVYLHNSLSADCTIRDLSPGGARIMVAQEAIVAAPYLIVVKEAVIHQSITAWKTADQAGLRFQNTTPLGGEIPPQLQRARLIWIELMPR